MPAAADDPAPSPGATATRRLDLARALLEQPTAPLLEDLPRAHLHRVAADAGLHVDDDPAGNVVVRYQGPGADTTAPLVLVAHLDHPGFAVDGVDGDTASLLFRGGLPAVHARPGTPLDLFEVGTAEPVGRAEVVEAEAADGRLAGAMARITGGRAAVGGFAMWGFPAWSLQDGRIVGRVCDDLMGAAAALAVLDELARRRPEGVAVWALFTRAEEIGFLGALEAIRHRVVPPGRRRAVPRVLEGPARRPAGRRGDRAGGRPDERVRPRPHRRPGRGRRPTRRRRPRLPLAAQAHGRRRLRGHRLLRHRLPGLGPGPAPRQLPQRRGDRRRLPGRGP